VSAGHARIDIDFAMTEGAVLRMVGLVERRGFEVRGIAMAEASEGQGAIALDVRPRDASRSLDIVAGHLRRLHEVKTVSCTPQASGAFQ
jgi:acetolactate synthase regulatory subunit